MPLQFAPTGVRRFFTTILAICVTCVAALFAGPVSSGAMLLLLPGEMVPVEHGVSEDYEPLHKGRIDLGTGLYVRENEDLVVRGVPGLVLRRTYLSNYRVSRHFGVGTTHDGEVYLIGDGARFQSASLILATGTRINFARVSSGASVWNALFEHQESARDWRGTRLGWTGTSWALRRPDGSLSLFKPCGGGGGSCSILKARDADGHTILFRRDAGGRLVRMETGPAWIAFEYDLASRVARAHSSARQEVRYEYDARGRLSRVVGHDGAVRRYTYTDADQMATIVEPGTDIENVYGADGRCIRQINRFPDDDDAEPYIFDFSYDVENGEVVRVETKRSDRTWSRYTFASRDVTSEAWGRAGTELAAVAYVRDAPTREISSLTLTCPDRTGRPLPHTSIVTDGNEEEITWGLLKTHCSRRQATASAVAPEPR